jgi:hypothetical protein
MRLLAFLIILFTCHGFQAQDKSIPAHYVLHLAPSFTYSGMNTELGVERRSGPYRLGLAYPVSLSESALFGKTEQGFAIYVSRDILSQGKWRAGAHLRVMQSFRNGSGRSGEYLIGQELGYALSERIDITQVLAIGMYEERLVSERFGLDLWGFGADGIVLLGINYLLGKKSSP